MLLVQLLSPDVLLNLNPDVAAKLAAVIEAEIISSPEIRQRLKGRLDEFIPHLRGTAGTTPTKSRKGK